MILVLLFKYMMKKKKKNRKLCEPPYNKTVDWAKWYIFWADERVVAKNHADSNYKLAKDGLLSKVCTSTSSILLSFLLYLSICRFVFGSQRG
jgi:hypothetical protein